MLKVLAVRKYNIFITKIIFMKKLLESVNYAISTKLYLKIYECIKDYLYKENCI